jgi:hypothetical protein
MIDDDLFIYMYLLHVEKPDFEPLWWTPDLVDQRKPTKPYPL